MAISGGSEGHVTQVSEAVEFPELSELTLCFEVERIGQKQVRRTTGSTMLIVEPPLVTSPHERHKDESESFSFVWIGQ